MLTICKLHRDSTDRNSAENLYLTAFPEIERHPIEELYDACWIDRIGYRPAK